MRPIETATSSSSARMSGPTAAIAEAPHTDVPGEQEREDLPHAQSAAEPHDASAPNTTTTSTTSTRGPASASWLKSRRTPINTIAKRNSGRAKKRTPGSAVWAARRPRATGPRPGGRSQGADDRRTGNGRGPGEHGERHDEQGALEHGAARSPGRGLCKRSGRIGVSFSHDHPPEGSLPMRQRQALQALPFPIHEAPPQATVLAVGAVALLAPGRVRLERARQSPAERRTGAAGGATSAPSTPRARRRSGANAFGGVQPGVAGRSPTPTQQGSRSCRRSGDNAVKPGENPNPWEYDVARNRHYDPRPVTCTGTRARRPRTRVRRPAADDRWASSRRRRRTARRSRSRHELRAGRALHSARSGRGSEALRVRRGEGPVFRPDAGPQSLTQGKPPANAGATTTP